MPEYHIDQNNWPPHIHIHIHTCIRIYTSMQHLRTSQHALHLFPQNFHFRVALHSNDYLTHPPQSPHSTLLHEACKYRFCCLASGFFMMAFKSPPSVRTHGHGPTAGWGRDEHIRSVPYAGATTFAVLAA